VVFTAHSLPQRVIEAGDPYAREVETTARGVAAQAGIGSYQRAYQSAGRTPEPWIGPDLSDLVRERAAGGVRRFLIVPIGFVCDHTEILFDIDVQARETAAASLPNRRVMNAPIDSSASSRRAGTKSSIPIRSLPAIEKSPVPRNGLT